MKDDVTTLKADVTIIKADVTTLKNDVQILKDDVTALKDDVKILKEDVTTTKAQVEVIGARLDSPLYTLAPRFRPPDTDSGCILGISTRRLAPSTPRRPGRTPLWSLFSTSEQETRSQTSHPRSQR